MYIVTRYSVKDSKYKDKRVVMFRDIPEYPVMIPKTEEHSEAYKWWPVVKLEFHENAINANGQALPKDIIYLVSPLQLLLL